MFQIAENLYQFMSGINHLAAGVHLMEKIITSYKNVSLKGNFSYFCLELIHMNKYAIIFLEWAKEFLDTLDEKTRKKIIYNIWKSRDVNDPELIKKLDGNI